MSGGQKSLVKIQRAQLVKFKRAPTLYHHRRVASHVRSAVRGGYTTVPEHMPASHRAHKEWSPARLLHWAAAIGPATREVVDHILQSKPHPEHGYRACLGMLAAAKKFGDKRLEAACERAVRLGAKSRKNVLSILEHGLEREPLTQRALFEDAPALPAHSNVRGPKYYH